MNKYFFHTSILLGIILLFKSHAVIAQDTTAGSTLLTSDTQNELSEENILSSLSIEENEWYVRFKEGLMFFDGWNEISKDILGTFPNNKIDEKKALVKRLGIKIGSEWCRDNNQRKIDTDMLKKWGKQLRGAIAEGPEHTDKMLRKIETEVDQLLEASDRLTLFSPRS